MATNDCMSSMAGQPHLTQMSTLIPKEKSSLVRPISIATRIEPHTRDMLRTIVHYLREETGSLHLIFGKLEM